jgi:hypothetical protein
LSIRYLKKVTEETDERVVAMEHDTVVMRASTDGMVKREWIEAALALAHMSRLGDLPKADEIFTDRLIPVKVD